MKGEGRLTNLANTLGRNGGSAHNPHPGQSPSPGHAATTAPDDGLNSQPGDVAGSAQDQVLGP